MLKTTNHSNVLSLAEVIAEPSPLSLLLSEGNATSHRAREGGWMPAFNCEEVFIL